MQAQHGRLGIAMQLALAWPNTPLYTEGDVVVCLEYTYVIAVA